MLDILQFVFSDFAHFVGCFMFWLLACVAVSNIRLVTVSIIKNEGDKNSDNKTISESDQET